MNFEFTFYWFPAFAFYALKDSQIVESQESKTKEEWSYSDDKWFTSTLWNEIYVGRRLRAEPKTLTSEGRLYHVVISRSFAWIPQHLAFRTITRKAVNCMKPMAGKNLHLKSWFEVLALISLGFPCLIFASSKYRIHNEVCWKGAYFQLKNHYVNTKNLFLV